METFFSNGVKEHPKFDETIEEIIQQRFDVELMAKALILAKNESQAEALYVLLKLGYKEMLD